MENKTGHMAEVLKKLESGVSPSDLQAINDSGRLLSSSGVEHDVEQSTDNYQKTLEKSSNLTTPDVKEDKKEVGRS